MILYLRSRQRLALNAALLGLFLFGCFLFGVFSVRTTVYGLMLVGAMFCLVVYWSRPEAMVWVALFLAMASLPQGLHVGKVFGPVSIYAYHLALLLGICYLIPFVRPRFTDFLLPAMFVVIVLYFAAVGFETGHAPVAVVREATFLLEMAAGFVLALLVVAGDYIKGVMGAIAVMLWFSAGMAVMGSLHGVQLVGREVGVETGESVTRVITTALTPAVAVLTALVAATIVRRVPPATYLVLGVPALVIALLAFSRNTLISATVAAVVAFLANLGWSALRRTFGFLAVGAAVLAVTLPGALFLLQHSAAGTWLGDQLTAYSHRVLGGVSASALAVDQSTLDRLAENDHLIPAIAKAPVFGHGLGYAYQLPFGNDPTGFTETLGTTYAHNFYLWWLVKAGAVGMAAFVVLASVPIVRALRRGSAPAKISAAVSIGLLVMCNVDPLPEESPNGLTLGLALGAAMAYASLRRTAQETDEAEAEAVDAEPVPAVMSR
ncbi:polymerase [Mycobacterium sp. 852002-51163_SCH5372311]|uniref:O-antigen ligase family protein n=1 Tax=Mycobacterium sp. 852002-51163_SCH5372311 TaxID=1834097 RepID=UPI0007FCC3B7|nr:O-antigen ligase family protein [Mycobacterium sp. 852002-51163_SCH5372311]OBF90855.1 polymerase [Mycobacterium sp. 852002-51163_SCH5372311]